jgi:hypothetical protein
MKPWFGFFLLYTILGWAGICPGQTFHENPRIAIVISRASFGQKWGVVQMSAHGWAGVANLTGIPYDCLFLNDLPEEKPLSRYHALVLVQCGYVEKALVPSVTLILKQYLAGGGKPRHRRAAGPLRRGGGGR